MACWHQVVNCSVSEGMAGALLEAMATATPVLARDIEGNRALAAAAASAIDATATAATAHADAGGATGKDSSGSAKTAIQDFDRGGIRLFSSPADVLDTVIGFYR
eukprot:COSAG05_NODE_3186_length_2259_cov_8.301389_1_plen_105_part_00